MKPTINRKYETLGSIQAVPEKDREKTANAIWKRFTELREMNKNYDLSTPSDLNASMQCHANMAVLLEDHAMFTNFEKVKNKLKMNEGFFAFKPDDLLGYHIAECNEKNKAITENNNVSMSSERSFSNGDTKLIPTGWKVKVKQNLSYAWSREK